ncbi:right-handed parallel beta-helix repeat-containing protein, partial [bacterium]|nr:right-handed parallel beta-helix repeat-containing protein [bacterium]
AAPGDTIQIGPGRYDDYTILDIGALVLDCYVNDNGKGLTYLGAGDETIIGPEQIYDFFETDSTGLWCEYAGMMHRIKDILVQHVEFGIVVSGEIDICDAVSQSCWEGMRTYTELGGTIAGYTARECWDFGVGIATTSRDLTIINCAFLDNYKGCTVLMGSGSIILINCIATDNTVYGIQYADNSTGAIRNSIITGSRLAVSVATGAQLEIVDCRLVPSEYEALRIVNGGSRVTGSGNMFIAIGDRSAIDLCNSHIVMSNSHILRAEGYAVKLGCAYWAARTRLIISGISTCATTTGALPSRIRSRPGSGTATTILPSMP